MLNWEKHIPEMDGLWATMKIIRDDKELTRVAAKITQYKDVYQKVEKETGVPWQMVGVIHLREAGEQDIGRFHGVLHNGEMLVGTGKRTRLVPKGRGPFSTWHSAAVDALQLEHLTGYPKWTPGAMLAALEPFNGYGYRNKGLRSPYVWASTNHQQRGKYVADRVFDANVMDTQVGCAAQLKYLGVGVPVTKGSGTGTVVAGGAAGTAAASNWTWFLAHWPEIAAGCIAAGLLVWFIIHRIHKYQERHTNVGQDQSSIPLAKD